MTKQEAIKELNRDSKYAINTVKKIRHLNPDKYDGYIKGITDQVRIAINIIKEID